MKTFKILSGSLIALMIVFSLCIAGFAAGPTAPVTQVQAPARVLPKLSADLVVQYVEYFNCPCTINQTLNTEYVTDGIWVKVGNASTHNSVVARVRVHYYDVSAKAMRTISKMITLNANQWTKVNMITGALLINKTQGVRAVIEHASTSYTDPNTANNQVIQKTCGQVPE